MSPPTIDPNVEDAIVSAVNKAYEGNYGGVDGIDIGVLNSRGQFYGIEDLYLAGAHIHREHGRVSVSMGASDPVGGSEEVQQSRQVSEGDDPFDYSTDAVFEPPFNFDMLCRLMTESVVHAAAIETKADDYAYNGWSLKRRQETQNLIEQTPSLEKVVDEDEEQVHRWLETCADGAPVEDLCRENAIEYENLGNSAFEPRRTRSGLIRYLTPVSFKYIRVINESRAAERQIHADFLQKRFDTRRYFCRLNAALKFGDGTFDPLSARAEDFPGPDQRKGFIQWNPERAVLWGNGQLAGKSAAWEDYASELYVVHRRPFTLSEVYGTPAGIQATPAILAHKRIEAWNLQFFASKGVPQYAVVLEGLPPAPPGMYNAGDDEDTKQVKADFNARIRAGIREFFQTQLTTADRNVLIISLRGETKIRFERLSNDQIEASFGEYEKRATEAIRLSHRVPGAAMGILETANLGSGRDTSQLRRYRDHIIQPGQRRLAAMINDVIRSGLLVPWFDFTFTPPDVEEQSTLRDFYLKAFVDGGISLNTFLRMIGENTLPEETGADVHFIRTANVTPIGEDLENAAAALRSQQAKSAAWVAKLAEEVSGILEGKGDTQSQPNAEA